MDCLVAVPKCSEVQNHTPAPPMRDAHRIKRHAKCFYIRIFPNSWYFGCSELAKARGKAPYLPVRPPGTPIRVARCNFEHRKQKQTTDICFDAWGESSPAASLRRYLQAPRAALPIRTHKSWGQRCSPNRARAAYRPRVTRNIRKRMRSWKKRG